MVADNETVAKILTMSRKQDKSQLDYYLDEVYAVPIYSVFKLQLRNAHAYRRILSLMEGWVSEVSALINHPEQAGGRNPDQNEALLLHHVHLKIREFNTLMAKVGEMDEKYPILVQGRGRGRRTKSESE